MKVKLIDVRLSFPDLWTAVQYEGQGPFNYRSSFLIPKTGHPAVAILHDAIKKVADEKWAAKAKAILEGCKADKQKFCLRDGDIMEYDGYAGHFALTTTRKKEDGRPDIRDRDAKTPLTAEDGRPYAGCYVDAIVEIWAQENKFGKAIRAQLIGMQFRRDGDSFGGGKTAVDSDFETLEDGADADSIL